ncbi:MAG TPA: hypothetical protein VF598_02885 [Hymenobacter sp.]|jgi:hypothetical protein
MRFSILVCAGLVACSISAKAQDTPNKYTVKGVVSYFFNANYGDKPDTGAKAYLLTDEDMKSSTPHTGRFTGIYWLTAVHSQLHMM